MRVVQKKVYYCDFCTKHGLSRAAMEKHERHCTMNPGRTCRWVLLDDLPAARSLSIAGTSTHRFRRGLPRWLRMQTPLTDGIFEALRVHTAGCPACMLATVRQSGVDRMSGFDYSCRWDYLEEVERFRADERSHWEYEERRDIEASFL